VADGDVALVEWASEAFYPIPLPPGSYRARYCARGMQLAHDPHEKPRDGSFIDSYALAFWPAEPAEDRIIKQTTDIAAYWHKAGPEMGKQTYARPSLGVPGKMPTPHGKEVVLPMMANLIPTILFKEQPSYTDEARNHGIQGEVLLLATFQADGTITDIRVERGLPYGLTEKAIEAAEKIQFLPAMKDGKPVSVYAGVSFSFKL
jgi:TonB family protein